MPVYYISEPKHWSPDNVGVSPNLYLSMQAPTEKCPVMFFNTCSKVEENMILKILWAILVQFWVASSGK